MQTANGVTWATICQSGLANPDSKIGVYAGDAESYTLFGHNSSHSSHAATVLAIANQGCWRSHEDWRCPPVAANFAQVYSTRIRVARNLADLPFPAAMRRDQRCQLYGRVRAALRNVSGRWFELATLTPAQRHRLAAANLLFTNDDRFMASAHIFDDWPEGRAIFVTPDWQAALWVNEEDHLRVMALAPGYQPAATLTQVRSLLGKLEAQLAFAWSPRLGYLTSCPSNLGTGLRASVLAHCTPTATTRLQQLGLQLRGTDGEHSAATAQQYDISPRQRLGISERAIVLQLDRVAQRF